MGVGVSRTGGVKTMTNFDAASGVESVCVGTVLAGVFVL